MRRHHEGLNKDQFFSYGACPGAFHFTVPFLLCYTSPDIYPSIFRPWWSDIDCPLVEHAPFALEILPLTHHTVDHDLYYYPVPKISVPGDSTFSSNIAHTAVSIASYKILQTPSFILHGVNPIQKKYTYSSNLSTQMKSSKFPEGCFALSETNSSKLSNTSLRC